MAWLGLAWLQVMKDVEFPRENGNILCFAGIDGTKGQAGKGNAGSADLGDGSLQFPLPLLHACGGVWAGLRLFAEG